MGLPYAMHQTLISLDGAAKMARDRVLEVTFQRLRQKPIGWSETVICHDVFDAMRCVVRDVAEQRYNEPKFLADAVAELHKLGLLVSQAKQLAVDLANEFQQTLNAACTDYDFKKVKLVSADLIDNYDVILTICDDPNHYEEQASCL